MVLMQYHYHFPYRFFNTYSNTYQEFIGYILLYGTSFIFPLLIQQLFYPVIGSKLNIKAIFYIITIIILFSFRSYFYEYRNWLSIEFFENTSYRNAFADNLFQGLVLFIPILFIYYITKSKTSHYGLFKKPISLKPYWVMLVIMAPVVYIASTQTDFQAQYPKYYSTAKLGSKEYQEIFLFELIYLFDFIVIELFFRGFVILSLKPILGKQAIMPMVCMYVSIHLWKPAGETISSFFGGLLLGILVYKTESIWGGIIAHCGIALLMELFGSIYI